MTAGEDVERQKFALRELFRSYNSADQDTVKKQVDRLVNRLLWTAGWECEGGVETAEDGVEVADEEEEEEVIHGL